MKKKIVNIVLGVVLALLLVSETVYSVNNTDFSDQTSGETIQLAHIPWDTEAASSNVLSIVLEEAGYNVDLIAVDEAILYESLANNEADLMTSGWMPNTHGAFYEENEESIVDLGPNLTDAVTSFVVPAYMDVESIDELDDEADQTITGIEPGAGTMDLAAEVLDTYDNLSGWELTSSSTGAMLGLLDDAIQNQEEIVILGWAPHWMFHEYDLRILEDPQGVFGGAENIRTMTREGFADDFPEAAQIADNFYWEIEDMESVTYAMENGVDERTAAQNWVDDNRDMVDSWLEGTSAEE